MGVVHAVKSNSVIVLKLQFYSWKVVPVCPETSHACALHVCTSMRIFDTCAFVW